MKLADLAVGTIIEDRNGDIFEVNEDHEVSPTERFWYAFGTSERYPMDYPAIPVTIIREA